MLVWHQGRGQAQDVHSFLHDQGAWASGLGLLISQKLASFHNGVITYLSTEGAGTTFTVNMQRIIIWCLTWTSETGKLSHCL